MILGIDVIIAVMLGTTIYASVVVFTLFVLDKGAKVNERN